MKKIIAMIAILAILFCSLSACGKGTFEDGYEAGYDKGLKEGYETGYDDGLNSGYDEGFYAGYCAAGGSRSDAFIARWNGDDPTLPSQ